MENPIKMDDLGGTTIFGNIHIFMTPQSVYLKDLYTPSMQLQTPSIECVSMILRDIDTDINILHIIAAIMQLYNNSSVFTRTFQTVPNGLV